MKKNNTFFELAKYVIFFKTVFDWDEITFVPKTVYTVTCTVGCSDLVLFLDFTICWCFMN